MISYLLKIKNKLVVCFLLSFLFLPFLTSASSLGFESNNSQYGRGETFGVKIKIDDVEFCVNAIEARVKYDTSVLQVEDFLIGESIINLWLNKPDIETISLANQTGSLVFSGGIPGGYCGKIPGDPGDTNIFGEIIFKVKEDSVNYRTDVEFGETRVLLNDGLGSEDELALASLSLEILDGESGNSEDYQADLKNDKTRPESFIVELRQDEGVFDNQYYIVFQTSDKQSGVDYYEVLEIRPGEKVGEKTKRSLLDRWLGLDRGIVEWRKTRTPHLLKDQTLESIVKVRAVDKAGNSREIPFIPPERERDEIKSASYKGFFVVLLTITLIVLSIIIIIIIRKKTHARKIKEDQF